MQELKTKRLGFILTAGEYAALKGLAARRGVSLATVLRGLIRAEAMRRALWCVGGAGTCTK